MPRLAPILLSLLPLGFYGLAGSAGTPVKFKSNPGLAMINAGRWKTIQPGVEHRKVTLEREAPANTLDLTLFRFDTSLIAPRVIYAAHYDLKTADVKTLAQKTGALAAINANYYDPEGKPLAFLKTATKTINARVSPAAIYSGIFAVKDRRPFFANRNDFVPDQADEGVQTGPLLLLGGSAQAITGAHPRPSRRALIGTDKDHRLFIAVTDKLLGGLSWAELQELFTAPQWQLQAQDLLALDGGASAQLYLKSGKYEEMIPGTAEVPVAIGFFAKAQ
jgi:exopolysaccharide biosynthesis protein